MDAKRSVLVVEDDPATCAAMVLILEMNGYTVASAANGKEALEYLRRDKRPGLILLDLMMPVLDGWGFCIEQQRDPALAQIPVILVSADGAVPQKAATLGAVGYLQKPVEVDQLLHTVGSYC